MDIQVRTAYLQDKPILEHLMQLYLYDFSQFERADVNDRGLYEYGYLESYWEEDQRHAFLIFVDRCIAGFVLVNKVVFLPENKDANAIAEFFVMRKYRRMGVGKSVAFKIFDKFPGKWEVQETKRNVSAQKFWRRVIAEYTNGRYAEKIPENKPHIGAIQSFDNIDQAKK